MIFKDVKYKIIQFADTQSIWSLIRSKWISFKKDVQSLLEKRAQDEFHKRLKTLIDMDIHDFNDLLISTNSVVAGSFPLQCLLGENWENDHISVLSPSKQNIRHQNRFIVKYWKWLQNQGHRGQLLADNISTHIDDHTCGPLSFLYSFGIIINRLPLLYERNTKLLCINLMKHADAQRFIYLNFHLDFCKILYDGRSIRVLDWASVLFMKSIYHYDVFWEDDVKDNKTHQKRRHKYMGRGFTIV